MIVINTNLLDDSTDAREEERWKNLLELCRRLPCNIISRCLCIFSMKDDPPLLLFLLVLPLLDALLLSLFMLLLLPLADKSTTLLLLLLLNDLLRMTELPSPPLPPILEVLIVAAFVEGDPLSFFLIIGPFESMYDAAASAAAIALVLDELLLLLLLMLLVVDDDDE